MQSFKKLSQSARFFVIPTPLRSKTGQTRIVVRTADRRQNSAAQHAIALKKSLFSIQTTLVRLFTDKVSNNNSLTLATALFRQDLWHQKTRFPGL